MLSYIVLLPLIIPHDSDDDIVYVEGECQHPA